MKAWLVGVADRGLTVEHADALDFLEAQPDGAFAGVFIGQLVEHLSTERLVALLNAVGRKTCRNSI